MAQANCYNGHQMWNGDGKEVIYAFRINYLRDYMKTHPDCILSLDGIYGMMYDICESPGEDLDCWLCSECGAVTIFVDSYRYDFVRMENTCPYSIEDLTDWEEYIVLRDDEFDEFQEFYQYKSPVEAIETFNFKYKCFLSPDKQTVCVFDNKEKILCSYEQVRMITFD